VKRTSAAFHDQWLRIHRAVLERNEDDAKRALVDIGYVKDPASFDFRPILTSFWTCSGRLSSTSRSPSPRHICIVHVL
jgi:hypothetical protein